MLTFVLVGNGLIGLVCLAIAWILWRLKGKLASISETLAGIELAVYKVLHPAPGYIIKGQTGTQQLRSRLQQLSPQMQRLRLVATLIGAGRSLWLGRSPLRSTRR